MLFWSLFSLSCLYRKPFEALSLERNRSFYCSLAHGLSRSPYDTILVVESIMLTYFTIDADKCTYESNWMSLLCSGHRSRVWAEQYCHEIDHDLKRKKTIVWPVPVVSSLIVLWLRVIQKTWPHICFISVALSPLLANGWQRNSPFSISMALDYFPPHSPFAPFMSRYLSILLLNELVSCFFMEV